MSFWDEWWDHNGRGTRNFAIAMVVLGAVAVGISASDAAWQQFLSIAGGILLGTGAYRLGGK